MVQQLQQTLRDSAVARWTVLILVASMMFFAYMFVDILSPLASVLNDTLGWNQGVFGTYASAEYILCVFGFLIFAGIILDKMGVRFTGLLSAGLMVLGASIKYIGISDWFDANNIVWLNSWWTAMPGSAKMAAFGFMIHHCRRDAVHELVCMFSIIRNRFYKGVILLHYHSVVYLYQAYSARACGFCCHRLKVDGCKVFRYPHSFVVCVWL